MTDVTLDTFVTSRSLSIRMVMILKSGPRPGNRPTIQSLTRSRGFPSAVTLFSTAASRTMPVTTGMTCVTTRMRVPRMTKIVRMASSPSGADLPRMRIFRSSRITGCPISDTTNATMMYTSTFLKYQHRHARMARVAAMMMYRASRSMLLSCSIAYKYRNFHAILSPSSPFRVFKIFLLKFCEKLLFFNKFFLSLQHKPNLYPI